MTKSSHYDIIKTQIKLGVEIVQYIGKIERSVIENEFGQLHTSDVVLTDERKQHIQQRHPEDYMFFEKYAADAVNSPDYILKDSKNKNTILMIKHIAETNINFVIRLAVAAENPEFKNSVMTFYRIRDKNVKKLIKKNKCIDNKEYL